MRTKLTKKDTSSTVNMKGEIALQDDDYEELLHYEYIIDYFAIYLLVVCVLGAACSLSLLILMYKYPHYQTLYTYILLSHINSSLIFIVNMNEFRVIGTYSMTNLRAMLQY
jgi:hypothetical protein